MTLSCRTDRLADGGPGTPPATRDPAVLLKYAQLCLQTGRTGRARQVLDWIGPPSPDWTPQQLQGLLTLAEKTGGTDAAEQALRVLLAMDRIPHPVALYILRMAQSGDDAELALRLRDLLEEKFSHSQRAQFRSRSLLAMLGPIQALAQLRRRPAPPRGPSEAVALAELLAQAGARRLCLRYLRACRHRWPGSFPLLRQQISALTQFGAAEEALALIDRAPAEIGRAEIARLRLGAFFALGRLQDAQALLDEAGRMNVTLAGGQLRMMLKIAFEDTAGAEALVPLMVAQTGRSEQTMAQFRISHLGGLLNELQLLARIDAPQEELQRDFYFPARRSIGAWQAASPRPAPCGAQSAIPRLVLQYWDSDDIPPAIGEVMQSWQDIPGYSYRRFTRRSALDFLKTRFDSAHVRAFKLANSPAEECDFLRLCLLAAEGGIYVDADDLLVGDPEELRGLGSGLVLYQESFGAVGNNIIAARPGHDCLRLAAGMARESLLARENDITWSKLGPGLITRALAVHLGARAPGDPEGDVVLAPEQVFRRTVQMHMAMPYKSTPDYWNSHDGQTPPEIMAVLASFAESQGAA
ncbi:glycosyltransferase [Poseidonocella sp. HB161398]|uniref:glycosyltransferase n=1 Tax=Poseidonocella sp. HB161398 TaxID=2320855 RepID=UPI00110874DB|nr:glycosyltransferase [Poseidonocella sp. HB161398]